MDQCWRPGWTSEKKEEKEVVSAFVPVEFFEVAASRAVVSAVLSRVVCRSVLVPGWEELVINVKVSDQFSPTLVDTGADANFIDDAVANEKLCFRNLVAPLPVPINMTLADGSAGPVIYDHIVMDLHYDGKPYPAEEFLLAPMTTAEIVLGQKFLKKARCCIDCGNGTVSCAGLLKNDRNRLHRQEKKKNRDEACPRNLTELTPVSKDKTPAPSSYFRAMTMRQDIPAVTSWEDPIPSRSRDQYIRTTLAAFRSTVAIAAFSKSPEG